MSADDEALAAYRRAFDLARAGGHAAEAEAGYHAAIANGFVRAWLDLGALLATQPGREQDEKAALRAAMDDGDEDTAARAALRLGNVLDLIDDDRDAARACYELAERQGRGAVAFGATKALAYMLASESETEAARDRLRSFGIWFGHERNQDMTGLGAEVGAIVQSTLSGHPLTRRAFRLHLRSEYRRRRRRQAESARSERATARSVRRRDLRDRLARRFWGPPPA